MDATSNGHHNASGAEDVVQDDGGQGTVGWTIGRILGVVAFLIMVVFWIYVFSNKDSIAHPDQFDDPVFVQSAETVCAARQAAIEELPLATVAEDPVQRGLLVEQGTAELERMIAELGALTPPTDPKGADGVALWLQDYELYLSDRRRFSNALAQGEDVAFTISGNAQGVRVTDLLGTFAEVNEMPSCAPSLDA